MGSKSFPGVVGPCLTQKKGQSRGDTAPLAFFFYTMERGKSVRPEDDLAGGSSGTEINDALVVAAPPGQGQGPPLQQ